jgi:hypothetical protein
MHDLRRVFGADARIRTADLLITNKRLGTKNSHKKRVFPAFPTRFLTSETDRSVSSGHEEPTHQHLV